MKNTLSASSQYGAVELRQHGQTWQVFVKPNGETAFHTAAAGHLTAIPSCITVGKLRLDKDTQTVTLNGKDIRATPTEFSILRLLMSEPTRVFKADELLASVDSLKRLRSKLAPLYVHNRPRVGWSLLP